MRAPKLTSLLLIVLLGFAACGGSSPSDSPPQYTVTFNANNGSENTTLKVTEGDKIAAPSPAPVKENYGFGGWYMDDETFEDAWDFSTDTVTKNITLYAKWNLDQYTVTFYADGGSPAPDPVPVNSGDKVTEPDAMSKTGHTLDGWYEDNGTFEDKWDFNTDTVSGDTNLYAKWNPNPYTVTFSGNGSTPPSYTKTVNYGEKIESLPDMEKSGYILGGWYRNEFFENEWDFTTDTVLENTILYAKWLFLYTVTFDAGNGTPNTTQKVAESKKITAPDTEPVRDGYTFAGWYRGENFATKWDFASSTVDGDITLRAAWLSPEDVEDFGPDKAVNKVFEAVDTDGWNTALDEIRDGGNNRNYVINITGDFSIDGSAADTFGYPSELKVSIRGDSTISLKSTGSALRIEYDTVIVRDTDFIGLSTKTGAVNNTDSLIRLSRGELTLRGSASVKDNTSTSTSGGGVYVENATFTMQDTATVSGNQSLRGDNYLSYGGGVYAQGTTFTMRDSASVSGNTASAAANASGGGVYVMSTAFTMRDSTSVSGNTTSSGSRATGGGVDVYSNATFTMLDAAFVSGNTSSSSSSSRDSFGGGVYVASRGTFTMRGTATVSGNTAAAAKASGGGVYVYDGTATFQIASGTIYGNTADENSNVVKVNTASVDGFGAALYKGGGAAAQHGTFEGDTFDPKGDLETTDNTIEVKNGELQE